MSARIRTPAARELRPKPRQAPIRLGFVPLSDAAPLIVAQEWGLFARHGLEVRLSRELGWASIRDKLVHGELDGAHALSTLPVALAHGFGCVKTEAVAGLILNLHGNAITLSNDLWRCGVRDLPSLRSFLNANRTRRTLTLGTVSASSTHSYLLRSWFQRAGATFDTDVRLVVVPPPQLVANLAAGHLDGFCAGEPWNSLAVAEGHAWVAATSADLAPNHPEKVFVVRADFDAARHPEHLHLLAALLEACELCDRPENHDAIARLLAGPRYLNLPLEVVRQGFSGRFEAGQGRTLAGDRLIFQRDDANAPTPDKLAWIARHLLEGVAPKPFTPTQLGQLFRHDLFLEAQALVATPESHGNENEVRLLTA
jgi:ABC-type nitrate/sulfonate/bicarbonate transport system substrate-binding protein